MSVNIIACAEFISNISSRKIKYKIYENKFLTAEQKILIGIKNVYRQLASNLSIFKNHSILIQCNVMQQQKKSC